MALTTLKNIIRIPCKRDGVDSWELIDSDGVSISAFDYFSYQIKYKALATRKRYSEVVAQFIDYLIEAKVFGFPASKSKINRVIDFYTTYLASGTDVIAKELAMTPKLPASEQWKLDVVNNLPRKAISRSSFDNVIAAVNLFLKTSELLAIEAKELAELKGIMVEQYETFINAFDNNENLTSFEKANLKRNSMFGGVIKSDNRFLKRPSKLINIALKNQKNTTRLDFPIEKVQDVIGFANNYRDKTLWLLLASSGIRFSEALNLRWNEIDVENQKVYIVDPDGKRFGADMNATQEARFKGRQTSITYLMQPFRDWLFEALALYVREEYIPHKGEQNYVFQYLDGVNRGKPYIEVTDKALNDNFQDACKKAGLKKPKQSKKEQWSLHSLRHMYGVYMLNEAPVDPVNNKFGLELPEVQKLMGHSSPITTGHYARKTTKAIERRLELIDKQMMSITSNQDIALLKQELKAIKND